MKPQIQKAGETVFPEFIQSNIAELTALCEKFPISLPTEKVAAFLHTDAESLKAAVEQGKCPFAYSWQKDVRGYRAFKIPTVTFYLWYTNCHGVPGV